MLTKAELNSLLDNIIAINKEFSFGPSKFENVLTWINRQLYSILQPAFIVMLIIPFTIWEAFKDAWVYCKEEIS